MGTIQKPRLSYGSSSPNHHQSERKQEIFYEYVREGLNILRSLLGKFMGIHILPKFMLLSISPSGTFCFI